MTRFSVSTAPLAHHPLADLNESKRLPGVSYKLAEGYGLDVAFTDSLDIDEKKMAVWMPYADGNRRDGVGDLLVVEGIDESRHRKNPIHLFDHGKSVTLPVGKVEDPETGRYTGIIDPVTKVAKDLVYYYRGTGLPGVDKAAEYDHALFCQQVFHLLAQKFIRGGSIGYQVIQARELPPEPMYGTPKGLLLISVLKLESSTVVMPANADTVRKGLAPDLREVLAMPSVCGKPLSPMLVKSLAPFASEKKSQLGYEGKANISQIIKEETSKYGGSAIQCNEEGGYCTDIAIDVVQKLGGGRVVRSYRGHDFISYQGRYYDAEAPNGVDSPEKLPYFIRHPEHAKKKSAEKKAQPSDDIDPDKARQILRDGEVNGKPLTDKQRGMFGAAAGGKAVTPADPNAATVHTRLPYAQAQAAASQTPKMGVRQKPDGFYVYDPKTGRDQFGPFFSEGIALRWAERLNMGKKNVKELRKKYRRTAKGLVRRLKRSSPGSSVIYLAGKDLEQARQEAEAKGIKFQHVSSRNGTARVKLIGDDGAIDEVAKSYGRLVKFQGAKALRSNPQDLYDAAIRVLGESRARQYMSGSIQELHRDYSTAYDRFRKEEERALSDLIALRTMMWKPSPGGGATASMPKEVRRIESSPWNIVLYSDNTVRVSSGGRFQLLTDQRLRAAEEALGRKVEKVDENTGRVKSLKAQPLREPQRTNIHAGIEEAGETVVARRAIMLTQNVYEYFAQPGERLTVVGRNDVGQMRVRNRAGVEQSVTSIDVRRKAMGTKAQQQTIGQVPGTNNFFVLENGIVWLVTDAGQRVNQGSEEDFRAKVQNNQVRFKPTGSWKSLKGFGPTGGGSSGQEVIEISVSKVNRRKAEEAVQRAGGKVVDYSGQRMIMKVSGISRNQAEQIAQEAQKAMGTKANPLTLIVVGDEVEVIPGSGGHTQYHGGDRGIVKEVRPTGYVIQIPGEPRPTAFEKDEVKLVRKKALKDTKSMKHTKKKDGEDLPVGDEATTASGEERQLPLGAQVLRRLHEDASLLLQDYDEMLGPLENENVKARLQSKLEGFTEELTELEEEFGKLYPDLGGLVGTKEGALEEAADLESDGVPDNSKEEYEEELEPTPKDMDTMDDDAVGSSSEEREEVSPEDALEGMEVADEEEEGEKSLRRKVKRLRWKYGKKGICPECQKEDCVCETDEKGIKVAPALVAAAAPAVGQLVGGVLSNRDKGYVKEAGGFLGEIGQPESILDDEGRMKSYHYHKTLGGIAQLDEAREDLEEGSEDLQDSGIPPAEFEPGAGAKGVGAAAAAAARHPRVRAAARGAIRGAVEGAASGKAADERQRTDKPKNPDDGNVRDERGTYGRPGQESTQPEHTKPNYQGKGQMEILGQAADFLKELAFVPELDDDYRGRSTEFSKGLNDFVGPDEEAPVEDPNEELPPDEGAPSGAPSGDPEGVVMEEEVTEEEPGMEVKFLADEADLQNKKIAELSRMLSRLPI